MHYWGRVPDSLCVKEMGTIVDPPDCKGKLKRGHDTCQSFIMYIQWSVWGGKIR